jgi:ketosteroid isomerase-like protein
MKSIGAMFTMWAVLLIYACAPPEPAVDIEAETAALRAAADAYHVAAEAADIEGFVDLNANDVLIMPPNAPNIESTEGARSMVTAFTELPGFQVRFETVKVEVAASGDMGYTLANGEMSHQGPDGETVEDRIRDFHLWKKDAEGSWKVAIDIWNSELPLPGAEH